MLGRTGMYALLGRSPTDQMHKPSCSPDWVVTQTGALTGRSHPRHLPANWATSRGKFRGGQITAQKVAGDPTID